MRLVPIILICFLSVQLFAGSEPYVMVLGTAQDGGYPQAGCKKQCCAKAWKDRSKKSNVSCLALIDPARNKVWLFDATPDFKEQWQLLKQRTNDSITLAGIFLTHAHIGHYTGLMNLGREAMGTQNIPVYAMPRMKNFLETNGPWSLLVKLQNIQLNELHQMQPVKLTDELTIVPMLVPHRDEFSETVGFKIMYQNTSAPNTKVGMLFIPDIDKWEKWDHKITEEVKQVKYAFIDATFFDEHEMPGRDLKDIPHPFVTESMQLFEDTDEKNTIYFIHMNHTNALLDNNSNEYKEVLQKGFHLAEEGNIYFFK